MGLPFSENVQYDAYLSQFPATPHSATVDCESVLHGEFQYMHLLGTCTGPYRLCMNIDFARPVPVARDFVPRQYTGDRR